MSDDSDYEEEEFLVYADFKNQLLPQEINNPKAAIKIIGIDSAHPVAEINGHIFKGSYDFAMGTEVFFEKDVDAVPLDPLFEENCKQKYKYLAKTNKVINFQRIYVEQKEEKEQQTEDSNSEKPNSAEENLKLNITYEEAIQHFPACNS